MNNEAGGWYPPKTADAATRLKAATEFIRELHAVAGHDIGCFGKPCHCERQERFRKILEVCDGI